MKKIIKNLIHIIFILFVINNCMDQIIPPDCDRCTTDCPDGDRFPPNAIVTIDTTGEFFSNLSYNGILEIAWGSEYDCDLSNYNYYIYEEHDSNEYLHSRPNMYIDNGLVLQQINKPITDLEWQKFDERVYRFEIEEIFLGDTEASLAQQVATEIFFEVNQLNNLLGLYLYPQHQSINVTKESFKLSVEIQNLDHPILGVEVKIDIDDLINEFEISNVLPGKLLSDNFDDFVPLEPEENIIDGELTVAIPFLYTQEFPEDFTLFVIHFNKIDTIDTITPADYDIIINEVNIYNSEMSSPTIPFRNSFVEFIE